MPRDGSGNYTLPVGNPVVTDTTIASTWANTTMSDIAVQLNNVLTRDGALGPVQAFKLVDGAVATPALAFNSEPSLGMYRQAASVIGWVAQNGTLGRLDGSAVDATVGYMFPRTNTATSKAEQLYSNKPVGTANRNDLTLGIKNDVGYMIVSKAGAAAGMGMYYGAEYHTVYSDNAAGTATLTVQSNAANHNGVNLRLLGGGANPSKTIRVTGGVFEVINNAYSAAILQIQDNGAMSVPGYLTSPAGQNFAGGTTVSGFLQVNNSSAITGNLNVNGDITAGGNVTFFSDNRLKQRMVRSKRGAKQRLKRLKGFRYYRDGRQQRGLSAQNVRRVYPELVHEVGGRLAVNYVGLISELVEAL